MEDSIWRKKFLVFPNCGRYGKIFQVNLLLVVSFIVFVLGSISELLEKIFKKMLFLTSDVVVPKLWVVRKNVSNKNWCY